MVPAEVASPHLRPLDPRVRTLWWLSGALTAVGLALLAVGAAAVAPRLRPWLPVAVAAVALATAGVIPILRYRRWRYSLTDTNLEIRRGVAWTTISVIPYSRLQFVDTKQGPLDRLFGLATLVVHTAAPGTSGTLPGLDVATAAALRARLSHLDVPPAVDDVPV